MREPVMPQSGKVIAVFQALEDKPEAQLCGLYPFRIAAQVKVLN